MKYYDYKLFASKVTIKDIDESNSVSDSSVKKMFRYPIKRRGRRLQNKPHGSTNGPFSWPPDTKIQVYFVRGMFTREQRRTLFAAMADWSEAANELVREFPS